MCVIYFCQVMNTFSAILLGIVQGVTEFLPVSSTGHLVLVRDWLQADGSNALAFDAVLHFATTAAVIIYFRSDLWALLQTLLRKLSRLPVNQKDWLLLQALVLATIPAVVVGIHPAALGGIFVSIPVGVVQSGPQ